MAWLTRTYSCGHYDLTKIKGGDRDIEDDRPCFACRKVRDLEVARRRATDRGYPSLTGSDKQVEWALVIRDQVLEAVETYEPETPVPTSSERAVKRSLDALLYWRTSDAIHVPPDFDRESVRSRLLKRTQASYWIDHRDDHVSMMIASAIVAPNTRRGREG